ncbi:MAG TPA: POTRA domain-containing protein [Acidobacteriaceae bacterium]|jgi:outer membrane protein assembly factor BamA|nr:POTRA domain-containing protein [Acidobacteriaceae bacterium]
MIRKLLALAIAPFCCLSVFAQSYTLRHILFKGETGYTNEELMTAAGLKKGISLTQAEMNEHTKLLMDTGFFQNVSFTFNGEDLVFQISPATVLVPYELENVPYISSADLDARLHARFPLYHGKVPAEGAFLDDARHELQAALKEKGITAEITAAPFTDAKLMTITRESFTISSPDISIGAIDLSGASADFTPLTTRSLSRVTGSAYSPQGSLNLIETSLNNVYGEHGYLGASYHIVQGATPVIDAAGVHIPFTVAITEGAPFKVAAINLAPGIIVTQADFEKQTGLHTGDTASLFKLRSGIEFLTMQYHNHGCMHAQVHAEPTLDRAAGAVTYAITAEPGPTFTMGALRIVNLGDDLHDALQSAWTLPAGAVFDESTARKIAASPNLSPLLKHALTVANIHSTLKLHEETHTVDVELTMVRKPL